MFSSVLCPVDFSEQSVRALRHAVALAGHHRGRLTALHVAHPLLVEAASAGVDVSAVLGEIERELRELVIQVTTGAGTWAPDVDVRVTTGAAAEDVVKYASDHAVSMIVMGTYGLTGYRKMLLGSVAERVLRSAAVPVLVLPQMDREQVVYTPEGPVFAIEKVLAPCDFSDHSDGDVRVAHHMAKTFSVPLLLVHVVEEVRGPLLWRDSMDELDRREVARAGARLGEVAARVGDTAGTETVVAAGSPAETIARLAAEHHVGLIVMGLGGEGGRFRARPGTTAYRVLSMAAAPVLALPG